MKGCISWVATCSLHGIRLPWIGNHNTHTQGLNIHCGNLHIITYTYIHTDVSIHTHTHIYITYIYIYIFIHVYRHIYVCACMYTYVRMYVSYDNSQGNFLYCHSVCLALFVKSVMTSSWCFFNQKGGSQYRWVGETHISGALCEFCRALYVVIIDIIVVVITLITVVVAPTA